MLLMAVWLEYSWLERTTTAFPDGVEVASTNQVRSWYRPWTYAVPLTNRLIAVDHRFDRRHAGVPDRVLTRVILAGRWEPMRQYGVVFDCNLDRRADLLDEVELDDEIGRHTSELQSLMRISYAVFFLKKKPK